MNQELPDMKNDKQNDDSHNMSIMMKWMSRMLPSCEEVSALTSEAMDETLPFRKRLSLKLHLKMCVWCRRNATQLQLMSRLARLKAQKVASHAKLSSDARDRITQALKQSGDQS